MHKYIYIHQGTILYKTHLEYLLPKDGPSPHFPPGFFFFISSLPKNTSSVKVPVAFTKLQALLWLDERKVLLLGMPSKQFVGMEVASNCRFGDLVTPKCSCNSCKSPTVILFLTSSLYLGAKYTRKLY